MLPHILVTATNGFTVKKGHKASICHLYAAPAAANTPMDITLPCFQAAFKADYGIIKGPFVIDATTADVTITLAGGSVILFGVDIHTIL